MPLQQNHLSTLTAYQAVKPQQQSNYFFTPTTYQAVRSQQQSNYQRIQQKNIDCQQRPNKH